MNPENTKTENQRVKLPPEQQLEILSRGTKDFIGREDLLKKLKSGRRLQVKAGFDPSRPDLHLGHSLLINKLRQFQELGHDVIFVVGDWTACIGDPSGQNKTRPALSFEESQKNAQTYKDQACKKNFTFTPHKQNNENPQLRHSNQPSHSHNEPHQPNQFNQPSQTTPHRHARESGHPAGLSNQPDFDKDSEKIFNFFKRLDPQKTEIVSNSKWFEKLSLRDFVLNIASKCTLARQLERDDFKKRFKENQPIALHELFYPLLQAYDSVELKADVEIGGTDQLFNLLLGRQLQESSKQAPQAILTLPLLKGLGAKVSSKKNLYQKILTAIKKIFRTTKKEEDKTKNWNIEGADKMSKSLGNAISFNDSPKDMYGKVMKLSDELLPEWWNLFTEKEDKNPKKNIFIEFLIYLKDFFIKLLSYLKNVFSSRKNRNENKLKTNASKKFNPKAQKEKLAWLLVCSFYGEDQADKSYKEFNRIYSQEGLPDEILEHPDLLEKKENQNHFKERELAIYQLVKQVGFSSSNNEAKRGIRDGAVRIRARWEEIHDLEAYLVYRKIKEGGDRNKLCEELSQEKLFKDYISLNSIKLKIANYKYLDVGEGLSNYSQQSKKIFDKHKEFTIPEIKKTIEKKKKENKDNFEDIGKKGRRIKDPEEKITLTPGEDFILSFGKRKFKRINTKWNDIHDLKVYLVYRKVRDEKQDKDKLCEELSKEEWFKNYISLSSIKFKIANYKYIKTKNQAQPEGLSNYSQQSKEIFDKYEEATIPEIEEVIKKLESKNEKTQKERNL